LNLWAPSEQTKKDVLVEFRAGRMTYSPNSKMVDPDKRKGLVQLKQSPEENLIYFLWKDRTTGTEVLKLILFPGDATFRKVEEAKSGRIFVLEWKTTDKKEFFWMQEPKDEKDKEFCDNINKFINEPPTPTQNAGAGGLGAALGGMDQAQLRQLLQAGGLGGMDPMQLLQMFGGGGEGLGALGSAAAGGRGQPRSGGGGGGGGSGGTGAPPQSRTIPSTRPPPTATTPAPALNRNTLQSILDGLIAQNPGQVPGSVPPPPVQAPVQQATTEVGGHDKKEEKKEEKKDEKMEDVTEEDGDKKEEKKRS